MSEKKKKALLIINILTIVFSVIRIQSMVAFIRPEHFSHYPLKEQIINSFSLYTAVGWANRLLLTFGVFASLSKFALFWANIYAVIAESKGVANKSLPPKFVGLILVKLLFIALSLVRIHYVVYTVMMGALFYFG